MGSTNSDQLRQQYPTVPLSVQTVLRVRPFLKRERDDSVVLQPLDATTVVVRPQPAVQMLSPLSALVKQTIDPENNHDQEFYFDHVLNSSTTQEDMYFSFGSSIAQRAMDPLKASRENDSVNTSLIIAMGLSNSGKTFSCWGDHCLSTQKLPQDGMLPRILDSLFSQSTHFVEKKQGLSFGVQISIVQVGHRDGVLNDLLKSSSRRSIRSTISSIRQRDGSSPFPSHNSVMIEQDPFSLECRMKNQQLKLSLSWEEARLTLKKAVKIRHDSAKPGHVLVQLRPVMVNRTNKVVEEGGQIAVLEMESLDNGKKIKAGRIKDSIPNRADAYASVMQCLRVALDNQTDPKHAKNVPFVQHKVTMLLQSIFSSKNTHSTHVTVLVTAYAGDRDYIEKKELLSDLQPLRQKCQTSTAFSSCSLIFFPISDNPSRSPAYAVTSTVTWVECVFFDEKKINEKEENEPRAIVNRKGTSHRKHSHGFSVKGEKTAKEEKTSHERNCPGKHASVAIIEKSAYMVKSPHHDQHMKYADSSVENIVPVPPPPVAPGYRPESSLLHPVPHKQIVSPLLVTMSRASAPVQETISSPEPSQKLADFPGVSVPQSLLSRNETMKAVSVHKLQQQKPFAAEYMKDGRDYDDCYINYMPDEADPGHSDKSVQSQLSFPKIDPEQREPNGRVFESHNVRLEDRLELLLKENEYLRAENERLRRDFTCLKGSLENTTSVDSSWTASHTKSSMDGQILLSSNRLHYSLGESQHATSGNARDPLSYNSANRYQ